jgi:hypothetical protein
MDGSYYKSIFCEKPEYEAALFIFLLGDSQIEILGDLPFFCGVLP